MSELSTQLTNLDTLFENERGRQPDPDPQRPSDMRTSARIDWKAAWIPNGGRVLGSFPADPLDTARGSYGRGASVCFDITTVRSDKMTSDKIGQISIHEAFDIVDSEPDDLTDEQRAIRANLVRRLRELRRPFTPAALAEYHRRINESILQLLKECDG